MVSSRNFFIEERKEKISGTSSLNSEAVVLPLAYLQEVPDKIFVPSASLRTGHASSNFSGMTPIFIGEKCSKYFYRKALYPDCASKQINGYFCIFLKLLFPSFRKIPHHFVPFSTFQRRRFRNCAS